MDAEIYFEGFLLAAGLMVIEHVTLYAVLRPQGNRGDVWRVLAKLILGTLASLAGCALIAWRLGDWRILLAPSVTSMAGGAIALAYLGRWIWERAAAAAYTRGRIHGMSDQADIAAEERHVRH